VTDSIIVADVKRALSTVMEPELHKDLMSLNMVRDILVEDGVASLTITLTTPACPLTEQIERDVRHAVTGVEGVRDVRVTWNSDVTTTRGLPGRQEIPGVKNIIAISAGKGGVGKTTVAVNVALALSQTGASVGLLDGDIYGPNVPIMLGISEEPHAGTTQRIAPLQSYGLKVMSFGTILKPGQPVSWRGPMLAKALREFLYEVEWGELDYLVVDLPPGTGDVQITLAQSVPTTGAVVVTTPQDVALADVSRGIQMFASLRIPVLGVVENMSGFVCAHCGEQTDVFGAGGGQELARQFGLPFLGEIPLDPRIRTGGGDGQPLMASVPTSTVAAGFAALARRIAAEVSKENFAADASPAMPAPRVAAR